MLSRCLSQTNLTYDRQSSLSNLTQTTGKREFYLKKSIFDPPEGLKEAYKDRACIDDIRVP